MHRKPESRTRKSEFTYPADPTHVRPLMFEVNAGDGRFGDSSSLFPFRRLDASSKNQQLLNMNAIAETPATELSAMIVHTPGILGGCPRLKGHRIGVHRVAGWWKLGLSIEEIGERLSALTPAEIHVALAYYHLHREEIERLLEGERTVCLGLEGQSLDPTKV